MSRNLLNDDNLLGEYQRQRDRQEAIMLLRQLKEIERSKTDRVCVRVNHYTIVTAPVSRIKQVHTRIKESLTA